MRNHFLAASTMVAAIFLSSCSRNTVTLESKPKGEVPQLGNLVFRFNKSIYPDSLLNNWDSTEYISFSPKIAGRFRWNGPDELVFSPSQPLQPATTYKANIQNDVLRYSKYNDVKEDDEVVFYTAPLQLTDAQVIWVLQDESSRTAVPQVNLQFNYPVKAEDVKDKLKIEIEGNKTDFDLQTTGVNNTITARLNSFKA